MTPADIRAFRKSLGLTAEQFAQAVGVTRDAVQKWESGARRIPGPLAVLLRLAGDIPAVRKRLGAKS